MKKLFSTLLFIVSVMSTTIIHAKSYMDEQDVYALFSARKENTMLQLKTDLKNSKITQATYNETVELLNSSEDIIAAAFEQLALYENYVLMGAQISLGWEMPGFNVYKKVSAPHIMADAGLGIMLGYRGSLSDDKKTVESDFKVLDGFYGSKVCVGARLATKKTLPGRVLLRLLIKHDNYTAELEDFNGFTIQGQGIIPYNNIRVEGNVNGEIGMIEVVRDVNSSAGERTIGGSIATCSFAVETISGTPVKALSGHRDNLLNIFQ